MPSQKQRKRRKCANCGRPVKGHVGPSGLNRCDNTPMAFQGANNNGQSPGGHSTGELSSPESNFPPAPPPAGTQPAQQPASASRPAPPVPAPPAPLVLPAPLQATLRRRQASPVPHPDDDRLHHATPRFSFAPSLGAMSPTAEYLVVDEYAAPDLQDRLPRSEPPSASAAPRDAARPGYVPDAQRATFRQPIAPALPQRDGRHGNRLASPRSPWDSRREHSAPAVPHMDDRHHPHYPGDRYAHEHRNTHAQLQDLPYRGRDTYHSSGRRSASLSRGLMDQAPAFAHNMDLSRQNLWPPSESAPVHYPHGDFGESFPPLGTEHLRDRVRERAINGEFVDLSELLNSFNSVDNEEYRTFINEQGHLSIKPVRQSRNITTAFRWLEAWSTYELLMCCTHGVNLFREMVAYRLFIIGLFVKYRLPYVLAYDFRHRQILGSQRSFSFSAMNHQLFIMTFDSSAVRSTPRCTRCNSSDHEAQECPFRPAGQASNLPNSRRTDRQGDRGDRQKDRNSERAGKPERGSEVCYLYQDGKCKNGAKCVRRHECISCGGPDGKHACKKCSKGGQ